MQRTSSGPVSRPTVVHALVKTVILAFCQAVTVSCSRVEPYVEVSRNLTLSQMMSAIDCNPTLKPTRKSRSLRFLFRDRWTLDDSRLRFEDGRVVSIDAALVDTAGNRYSAEGYGQVYGDNEHAFEAVFDLVPPSVRIARVEVVASETVACDRIRWHRYDPY